MSDDLAIPPPPPAAASDAPEPKTEREFDFFMLVQGVAVVAIAAIAGYLTYWGDPHDAAALGIGLIGALAFSRKQSANP